MKEVIKVTESPRDESEASDIEERIEDLGIDLEPFLSAAIPRVPTWVRHGWSGSNEDQEEHPTPGDNVKGVNREEETERGCDKFPGANGSNADGLHLGMFWRELISILIWHRRIMGSKNCRLSIRRSQKVFDTDRVRVFLLVQSRGLLLGFRDQWQVFERFVAMETKDMVI